MADYYSILKKTIASLPESNGAARRSVYSRARNAIVNQLKAYEPPLSPSEITAEQLRLEEAIRKVEAEAARESLGLTPAAVAAAPAAPPPVETPESAPADTKPPEAEPSAPGVPEPEVPSEPIAEAPPPVDTGAEEEIPSPLKETLSEAEALGSAANQAVQNAKEAVETTETSAAQPASELRQEPVFADEAPTDQAPPADAAGAAAADEPPLYADEPDPTPEPKARTKRERPRASEALKGGSSSSRTVPISLAVVALAILLGAGAYFFLPLDTLISTNREQAGTSETQSNDASQASVSSPEPAPAASSDSDSATKNTDRLFDAGDEEVIAPDARTVTTTTINPQTNEPAPAPAEPAITAGNQQVPALVQPVPVQPEAATPPSSGAETPSATGESDVAAVNPQQVAPEASPAAPAVDGAQRSILYEEGEDASGTGTASEGAVVWGFAEEVDVNGQQQSVLTASVDIPERDVKVDIRIKPNEDPSLPASHLVEIKYDFPESFAAGDVVNVPGLVMKPTEEARGDALIGASVKVQPGFFWIALSNLPNEQLRNLNLLRERGWIDIPMLYENGKRGILTLEKGADGSEAVSQAVAAWQAG